MRVEKERKRYEMKQQKKEEKKRQREAGESSEGKTLKASTGTGRSRKSSFLCCFGVRASSGPG